MSPEPSFLLPVTPWITVSAPLGNALQILSYCTLSSPLPLAVTGSKRLIVKEMLFNYYSTVGFI
jgi:hypothetical protein